MLLPQLFEYSMFNVYIPLIFLSILSSIVILPNCCKKSKKSSKLNNKISSASSLEVNNKKKKFEKKEEKVKNETNGKQKQTSVNSQQILMENNKPVKKKINKKVDKDEVKIKKKEKKHFEFKTARSFRVTKSLLGVPSESMMSKHEIVGVNFIASTKNSKPPKGQSAFSIFDQIRRNAAQHLLEDMSSMHAYDQIPLIDQMRMPKEGKEPILSEANNEIYVCDDAETLTVAASTSTEPDHQISLREPIRREIAERHKMKKY